MNNKIWQPLNTFFGLQNFLYLKQLKKMCVLLMILNVLYNKRLYGSCSIYYCIDYFSVVVVA